MNISSLCIIWCLRVKGILLILFFNFIACEFCAFIYLYVMNVLHETLYCLLMFFIIQSVHYVLSYSWMNEPTVLSIACRNLEQKMAYLKLVIFWFRRVKHRVDLVLIYYYGKGAFLCFKSNIKSKLCCLIPSRLAEFKYFKYIELKVPHFTIALHLFVLKND